MSQPSGGGATESNSGSTNVSSFGSSGLGRTRGNAPVSGTAQARALGSGSSVAFPFYGPWGNYYPVFGGGLGYGYRYVSYDPWRYGATSWVYGRYGLWYDPYAYEPYAYYPYYYGDPYATGYSSSKGDYDEGRSIGSVRLKADPKNARVYVDGALVGTVDEFDGLSNHLDLDKGAHEIELRADGYQTLKAVINVEAGRTITERLKMKKQ